MLLVESLCYVLLIRSDGFPTREGFDAAPWCSSFMLLCFGLFFAAPTGYIAVLYAINGEDYAVN